MDLAGTAVGIVSLGLQVCNGIIAYYSTWKGADQEIDNIIQDIESLKSILQSFQVPVSKLAGLYAPATSQIDKCLISCNVSIHKLEEYLKQCHIPTPSLTIVEASSASPLNQTLTSTIEPLNLRDKIKNQAKKAIFPFRRDSLISLKARIQDLKQNLSTAVDVLQLNVAGTSLDQSSTLLSVSESNVTKLDHLSATVSQVEGILTGAAQVIPQLAIKQEELQNSLIRAETTLDGAAQAIPRINDNLTQTVSLLQGTLPKIREEVGVLSQDVPKLEANVLLIPERVVELIYNKHALFEAQYKERLYSLETEFNRLKSSLVRSPGLLKAVCDDAEMAVQQNDGASRSVILSCSCRPTIERREHISLMGPFAIFRGCSEATLHSDSCIYAKNPKRENVLGIKLLLRSKVLSGIVHASMMWTSGAGGCSLSPDFGFCSTVPFNSPAFLLIRELCAKIANKGEKRNLSGYSRLTSSCIDNALLCLRKIFAEKRGHPSDCDPSQNNLLHIACSLDGHREKYGFNYLDRDALKSYHNLIDEISLLMQKSGTPIRESNVFGDTPLDLIFKLLVKANNFNGEYMYTSIRLIERGAHFSHIWRNMGSTILISHYSGETAHHTRPRGETTRYLIHSNGIDEFVEGFQCGLISKAVLERSEASVRKALSQSHGTATKERDALGQSPLHLAVAWPLGVSSILESLPKLVEAEDLSNMVPLALACYLQNEESIELLLEADSPFQSEKNDYFSSVLVIAMQTGSLRILKLVLKGLICRRRRLKALALENLPSALLNRLSSDRLLDADAMWVYEALKERNVQVPKALRPHSEGSVYHILCNERPSCMAEIADFLYADGFRDADSINKDGSTPLMIRSGYFPPHGFKEEVRFWKWLVNGDGNERRIEWGKKQKPISDRSVRDVTNAHFLALKIGAILRSGFNRQDIYQYLFSRDDKRCNSRFDPLAIVCSKFHLCDECKCGCSNSGCQPFTALWKTLSRDDFYGSSNNDFLDSYRDMVVLWLSETLSLRHKNNIAVAIDIIRIKTFNTLKLTHTCCLIDKISYRHYRLAFNRRDIEDIEEILSEQASSLEHFENLISHFIDEYIRLNIYLQAFLDGYWKTKMKQVLRKQKRIDPEGVRKLREIGVRIEESSYDESESENEDDEACKFEENEESEPDESEEWEDAEEVIREDTVEAEELSEESCGKELRNKRC